MRRNPARPAYQPVTDTPAFRRWFRASKVVDEHGEPLVVYHGTTGDILMFDATLADTNAGTGVPYGTFYFSSSPNVAATYVARSARRFHERANIVPAYLSLQRPLVVNLSNWAHVMTWNKIPYRNREWTLNELAAHAKRRGYDGLIVKPVWDVGLASSLRGSGVADTYVAFDPRQIKSATGNVGTFDPADPRIAHNPSRRRNGVSEAHRAEKPDAVVMDPKRMARVFIENPKVRQNPARQNPASKETFLEGVERRSKRKGKAERAVGKAQLAQGGAVLGMAVAKKAAPAVALRLGATVGVRAIPVVGEVLMVVGAGKEAYKVGKRRLKGGGGSWKTDLAKVGAGAVGLEDFVPEAEKSEKLKKNPRRKDATSRKNARGTVYFDMDETLLHTTLGKVPGLPYFRLEGMIYSVAVRPDAMEALLEAAKHANVNVLTTADRQYALNALDAAGLLIVASPIRKVYSTREPDDVPPPSGPWVLLDNDLDSAAEKTQVLVGYDDFERVTIVPDYLAQPRAGRTSLLTGLKKALRKLASRN